MTSKKLTRKQIVRELRDIRGHLVIASGMTTDVLVSMGDIKSRLVNVQIDVDNLVRKVDR